MNAAMSAKLPDCWYHRGNLVSTDVWYEADGTLITILLHNMWALYAPKLGSAGSSYVKKKYLNGRDPNTRDIRAAFPQRSSLQQQHEINAELLPV